MYDCPMSGAFSCSRPGKRLPRVQRVRRSIKTTTTLEGFEAIHILTA